MNDLMLRYFREEARVTAVKTTISGTVPTIILPANRLRYAVVLPNSTGTRNIYHFGESWDNTIGFFVPTNQFIGCINEDVWGEIIRLPIWGWCDIPNNNVEIIECSYDPTRYAQMMRCVNAELSRYGAS